MNENKKALRVMADCRQFEGGCSLTVVGTEEEVLPIAIYHAVTKHGHEDTPAFRAEVKKMLVAEKN